MKQCILILLILIFSCSNESKKKSTKNIEGSVKIINLKQKYIDTSLQGNFPNKIILLENEIDSMYDLSIIKLMNKLDTSSTVPLIEILKNERRSFKSDFNHQSELIFMSYGISSQSEEREYICDGYYYILLRQRIEMLRIILINIDDFIW